MSVDIHSMHVDYLAAHHRAIEQALRPGGPSRIEAAEHAVEVIQELVRDDMCDLTMVVAGVDREAWDEIDAPELRAGCKREFARTALGQPIVTIDYLREG